MRYRAEIDGLRALAVLPVILFHAGVDSFSGGFAGVDVFFVISGYLITGIIADDLAGGRFRLSHFYARRARRILPALFVVVIACIPAAWLLLTPVGLKDFAGSLLAVAAFSSNFLFWAESGYFGPQAELQPLLHTWSLAIEEQFYLLFPLLLLALWGLRPRLRFWLLILVALSSLALAHWTSLQHPTAGFFLLPTRAWELLLGAIAALYTRQRPDMWQGWAILPARPLREILSAAGLVLILTAVLAFDSSTPTPGFATLVPTTGAVLVILFACPGTVTHRLLASRVLVGLGLISYSSYLWHFPLLSFARHYSFQDMSTATLLAVAGLTFPLAYLTWRFVEQPFRRKDDLSKAAVFRLAALSSAGVAAVGLVGYLAEGYPERFELTERQIAAYESYEFAPLYRLESCFLLPEQAAKQFDQRCLARNPQAALIWGDSHAAALYPGLAMHHKSLSQYTASGCPPIIGEDFTKPLMRPNCRSANDHLLTLLPGMAPSRLYLHANWFGHQSKIKELKRTLRFLSKEHPDLEVVVIGGVPQWLPGLPQKLLASAKQLNERHEFIRSERYAAIKKINRRLERMAIKAGARFVDPLEIVCRDDGACLASITEAGEPKLMAWDYGHLTAEGSQFLAERIVRALGD